MEKKLKNFLDRLEELRNGESVSAFARRIGLPQKTLDHLVKGERKPSVEVVRALALSCNVSADWLLGLPERTGGGAVTVNAPVTGAVACVNSTATVGGDCSRCQLMAEHIRQITGRG